MEDRTTAIGYNAKTFRINKSVFLFEKYIHLITALPTEQLVKYMVIHFLTLHYWTQGQQKGQSVHANERRWQKINSSRLGLVAGCLAIPVSAPQCAGLTVTLISLINVSVRLMPGIDPESTYPAPYTQQFFCQSCFIEQIAVVHCTTVLAFQLPHNEILHVQSARWPLMDAATLLLIGPAREWKR